MNNMLMLVRREFWEHRSLWIAPLVWVGLIVIGSMWGTFLTTQYPDAITIAAYVRGSLGADPEAAHSALRAAAGEYASYPAYARQFAAMGLGDEAAAAGAAHRAGAPQAVPEALVRSVCLPADPAAARARLEGYREAGADLPVVSPGATPEDGAGSVEDTLRAAAPTS